MNYKNEISKILAEDIDDFSKKIMIIGIITTAIKEKLDLIPVVVGGQAVEFYTGGGYATMDIDLICETSITEIGNVLESLGFYRDNKYWILDSETINIAVEIPSGPLAGSKDKLQEVEAGSHKAYFIGIEDIIIDRLNAYVHWNEEWQEEWILGMIISNYENIDWDYLKEIASQEKVLDTLNEISIKAREIAETIK